MGLVECKSSINKPPPFQKTGETRTHGPSSRGRRMQNVNLTSEATMDKSFGSTQQFHITAPQSQMGVNSSVATPATVQVNPSNRMISAWHNPPPSITIRETPAGFKKPYIIRSSQRQQSNIDRFVNSRMQLKLSDWRGRLHSVIVIRNPNKPSFLPPQRFTAGGQLLTGSDNRMIKRTRIEGAGSKTGQKGRIGEEGEDNKEVDWTLGGTTSRALFTSGGQDDATGQEHWEPSTPEQDEEIGD
ncbi:unnamed protein product, partial [Protopolystoma xenopodis]